MKKGRTQGTGAGLPLSAMNEMYKKTLPVQYSTAWDRITLKTYLSRMKDNLCIICALHEAFNSQCVHSCDCTSATLLVQA